jgi:methylated-DNA-[protein]-cysteine S-methyltransferase
MRIAYHVMSSPVGLLFVARTERGLRYLQFMERKSLKRMIATHDAEVPAATWEPSLLGLKPYVDQLEQYFSGDRTRFTLPLDLAGSPFQLEVWNALREIPYGDTRSYADIARAVKQPRASRAVGLANNQNPVAIVVPCHRVIGAHGDLVGYAGGLQRKKWLLDHEARFARPVGRTGDLFMAATAGGELVPARPAARRSATPATRSDAKRDGARTTIKRAPKPASRAGTSAVRGAVARAASATRRRRG